MNLEHPSADRNHEKSKIEILPTVDEAIGWLQEHGLRRGEIGLSHGNRSTLANAFNDPSLAPSALPIGSDGDVVSAMERLHTTLMRERKQQEVIQNNKPLLDSIQLELDQRILALNNARGPTKRLLANASLPRKIHTLYKLQHPDPNLPKDSVKGWVSLKPLMDRSVQVNLPVKVSIDEVYSLLEYHLQSWQAQNDNMLKNPYHVQRVWTYRPVYGKVPLYKKPAEPLSSDIDYRIMIDDLMKKSNPRQTSVLLEMEGVKGKSKGTSETGDDTINHNMAKVKGNNIEGGWSEVYSRSPNTSYDALADQLSGDFARIFALAIR